MDACRRQGIQNLPVILWPLVALQRIQGGGEGRAKPYPRVIGLPLPVVQAIGNAVALVGLLDGVLAGLSASRVAPHLLPLLASAVQVSLPPHGVRPHCSHHLIPGPVLAVLATPCRALTAASLPRCRRTNRRTQPSRACLQVSPVACALVALWATTFYISMFGSAPACPACSS